ncbi:Nramp family divalent metal transporter [Mangrovimonas sp. DI 80]|uniref:Nramp family divalent metal transporter n=1 Tax=Mangrovimonas sp. DI 80 TaxID=1779330 RepID=UPI0009772A30|nr:Nramp family divalent metal transporter [Mangrovimonas sp. DI 80]OMP31700.1 iron transporter [Mangrovimonas sp. DI 80]
MSFDFKKLGPGLLFAGAAIGVSHLVQSTRAGADYGFGLVWALLLVNLFKYPFFQFGPRYAMATGESLLEGYKKLGKGVLFTYTIVTLASMFTIQTAVTIVTAGLAHNLFGNSISLEIWTVIILFICVLILLKGKYRFLDKIMKGIVVTLTISTLIAVVLAFKEQPTSISFLQILPKDHLQIAFLIAFMGWMPAPLDISIWHSLWTIEKKKEVQELTVKSSLFDFNIGFIGTIIIGLGFLTLGALVMHQSSVAFSAKASEFSNQLISMYSKHMGAWTYPIIGIAAFTTMFSTTLTTMDASPRSMAHSLQLLFPKKQFKGYLAWMSILLLGTILIFFFLASEMGLLIQIATILSFLTAPFFAIANYVLICSQHTPTEWRPSMAMHIWSLLGIVFLIGFSAWYLSTI